MVPSRPSPLPKEFLAELVQLLPDGLLSAEGDRWPYGYDNSRLHQLPAIVALPADNRQLACLLALCQRFRIPVTPRGAGTGTAGGAVPCSEGLLLSLERFNRILEVDTDNRLMVVQAGVTNQAVQQAAAEHGFFWPPDPTSSAICTVGGNLACNAAGPRAVKYGTPRENTLGLLAVTADGREIRTGVRTSKGVVGYDLTRLLIGSEGTLAVIAEATLKLTPLPGGKRTLRAVYRDISSAARAVSRVMAQPVTPCALEFIDGNAIAMVRDYSEVELPDDADALLMIEVDGPPACLDSASEAVRSAAAGEGCIEVSEARTPEDVARLWATRKALSPALRNVAPKKINEDVVVPVSRMPELVDGLSEISRRYAIPIVNFGHAGNGNIHVNLLVDPDDSEQMRAAEQCLNEVFSLVLDLGGTLSGEHGVGSVKRLYIERELDPASLSLMQAIKHQFDPHGVLNPGKTLPGI